jgi:hypothetical protein
MFRTSIVHPQRRFQAECCKFCMWYFSYAKYHLYIFTTYPDLRKNRIAFTRKSGTTWFGTSCAAQHLEKQYSCPVRSCIRPCNKPVNYYIISFCCKCMLLCSYNQHLAKNTLITSGIARYSRKNNYNIQK